MNGVIYILTNPSFPDYVKIGYADDIESRLNQLNRSECIPFAFRVYATYEVSNRLVDLKLHNLIDQLNPTLRSIENFNGKQRKREFYAMSKEDAYAILEAIAEIHGYTDRLKLWEMNEEEVKAEKTAQEIEVERRARSANFNFNECQIPVGAVLVNIDNPDITCTVVDERRVKYNGEVMFVTTMAKLVSGKSYLTHGPRYLYEHFLYKGASLGDIKGRKDDKIGVLFLFYKRTKFDKKGPLSETRGLFEAGAGDRT